MAKYLSQEWLDRQRELLSDLGTGGAACAGRVQRVVTGGPSGDVTHHYALADGSVTDSRLGDEPEADLTFTCPYEVALAIDTGELDASVAYMQGRLKATGNLPLLHALLLATHSPAFTEVAERLRSATET
jgi:hypothetical protein